MTTRPTGAHANTPAPAGSRAPRLLPARLENLPTEQEVQPALPVASEAKPTVQFVHNDAAVPENLPGAQSEQFTARPGLKLPASHAEQVVAFSRLSVLKPGSLFFYLIESRPSISTLLLIRYLKLFTE